MRKAVRWALAIGLGCMLAVDGAAAAGPVHRPGVLELSGHQVKWGAPAPGRPASIRYAFLREVRWFVGARNCLGMMPLDFLTRRWRLQPATVADEIAAAFTVWSGAAQVEFREVADAHEADILIGAQLGPQGIAFTNLREAAADADGIAPLRQAAICLDANEPWQIEGDGDPKTYVLRRVVAHEIGHAIGLDHYGRRGGIMGFGYDDEPVGRPLVRLSPRDLAAVTFLYGTRPGSTVTAAAEPAAWNAGQRATCVAGPAAGASACRLGIGAAE